MKRWVLCLFILLAAVVLISGCNADYKQLFTNTKKSEEKLVKAEIHFSENSILTGYIKSLGVEDNAKIYVGGASLNYLYDQQGNIIGSYNYQRVEFIKILPE